MGFIMLTTSLFSSAPNISLGQQCGYVLHEEKVQIDVELCVYSFTQQPVSIQLWACNQAFEGGVLEGYQIAATQATNYSESCIVSQELNAVWPIASKTYFMVLVLVEDETIISYLNFSQQQSFLLPYLIDVKTQFMGNEVFIDIGQIYNPRAIDNLSGTLSLELWSLSAPYLGDPCEGELLTIQILGILSGQNLWEGYQLTASLPTDAKQLGLMLREWTPKGYVTRDFVALSVPVVEQVELAPVIDPTIEVVVETEAVLEPIVEVKADVVLEEVSEPSPAAKPPKATQSRAKPVKKPSASVKKAPIETTKPLPLNEASVELLCSVKGISQAVARTIVESRPYKTWHEVGQLKGVGGKLLAKLRTVFHI